VFSSRWLGRNPFQSAWALILPDLYLFAGTVALLIVVHHKRLAKPGAL